MSQKFKALILALVALFFLGGMYFNSQGFQEQKSSVYSELKEKYKITQISDKGTTLEEKDSVQTELTVGESQEQTNIEQKALVENNQVTVDNRTTVQIVWDYLIEAGYSKIQVAGIIGNLYQESGVNPNRVESNGEGIGLVQWSFGRKQQLIDFAKTKGTSWKDLNTQLEFLVKELKGGRQLSGKYAEQFANPYSVDQATEAICWGFERPNAKYANLAYRKQMAWKTYYANENR